MKIDLVLTACNMSDHYLKLYPNIVKVWKQRFNLDCHLILIADTIPDFLKNYPNIILFKPIEGVNNVFTAQVIRILYPALYQNKNIMITDADIVPISTDYFINSIEKYPNDTFISFRDKYLKQNMLAICYNVANSNTWKNIFNINSEEDITKVIKSWYHNDYNAHKNCIGWYTDQQKLYEYATKSDKLIILKDKDIKFKRLDKRQRQYILTNLKEVKDDLSKGKYTDFHLIKPYNHYKKLIDELIDIICSIK